MIMFWVIVTVLLIISVFIISRPLLGKFTVSDDDRRQQNIQIAKDRLKEIESEYNESRISESDYTQMREELEQGLLTDIDSDTGSEQITGQESRQQKNYRLFFVLFALIPLTSISLYFVLGNPEMISRDNMPENTASTSPHGSGKQGLDSVEVMVEKLAKRLENKPNDAQGWYMLGRSYMSLNRFKDAAYAFAKAHALVGDEPDLLLRYADTLAMAQNGTISGKPLELVEKALQIKPNDPTGLWLAGMGYEEQGKFRQAVLSWQKLLPILKDEKSRQKVQGMIARVNAKLGGNKIEITKPGKQQPVIMTGKSIRVYVDIEDAIKASMSMDTTVFVFAKAVTGPPMPLAVARKQLGDLPVELTLDDSMAMMEAMKLSRFDKVNIEARLSRSGSALPQSGDFQSDTQLAHPGQPGTVKLRIQHRLP